MPDTRPFDPALFGEAAIDAETAKLNADMIELLTGQPEWWIMGAEAMRAARRRGEGPFPAAVLRRRDYAQEDFVAVLAGDGHGPRPARHHRVGFICISTAAAGCLAAQTCKTRCWSGLPTIRGRPSSPWSIVWHRSIPTLRATTIAKPLPRGWCRTARKSSARTL